MSWKDNVRSWNGKLYKVLQGNKSCHGGDFEWDLPKGDKPGDWTPTIEDVRMCERGYHLATHYAHWADKEDVSIYEAEGDVVVFDDYDKVVCTRVRLLKLVENPFDEDNFGGNNSGKNNIGKNNSGNYNSGNYNIGNHNSGMWNSGNYNSGFRNSGNWNHGCCNSGYFCVGHSSNKIFDKPIPENWELKFPKWIHFELRGDYYTSWQKAFEGADVEGIEELLSLPNFDYYIFEKITSITKKQIEEKLGK